MVLISMIFSIEIKRGGMPIFYSSQLIFIHIPKTAGSSIDRFFFQKEGKDINTLSQSYHHLFGFDDDPIFHRPLQHFFFYQIQQKFPTWEDFNYLSVVRNPYDRAVSDYFYSEKELRTPRGPFADFLKDFLDPANMEKYRGHPSPQYQYLEGCPSDKLTLLRFETLGEDFLRAFGEPLTVHDNYSIRERDYRTYYTVETAKIVEDYYQEDFRRFHYPANLSQELDHSSLNT